MTSRISCSLLVLSLVAGSGCGDGGSHGSTGAGSVPSARQDGLRVGPSVHVGQGVASLRSHFRVQGNGFVARGAQHQVQLADGLTRIRHVPSSAELRQAAEARRRGAGRGGPLLPAALELKTLSIARAGHQSLTGAAAWAPAADGKAERRFEHGREQWTNVENGAEVAYQFAERPEGAGDLVVSVQVGSTGAGAPVSVRSDARGLHLQMADGHRFFYEHATWVDAVGVRTQVLAQWRGAGDARSIQLVVPAALLNASQYPATLDPLVGPDLGTDTPVLAQASGGAEPDVATDGSNFLTVFDDAQRIRAVRVDAAGHVLDNDWLDLGEEGKLQFEPAVTYGGGHYLVAWWEDDGTNVLIRSRLLNQDGTLVGAGSVTLSPDTGFDAALAWNGSAFVASWIGYGETSGIRVALLDAAGQVVPDSEHFVSTNGAAAHPSLAVAGDSALVAWEDASTTTDFTNRVRAARIAPDGNVLDPEGFRLSSNESDENQPRVTSDGEQFLVVWHRAGASGLPGSVDGALVAASGVVTAPDFPISRSSGEASYPAVAFDGEAFAVAWKDEAEQRAMHGALVSRAGVVGGAADSVLSNVPASPASSFDSTGLAWNGSQFLLVFQGDRPNGFDDVVGIEGSLIGPDLGLVPGPLGLSQLRAGELIPSVVWNGRNYVVSWVDERTGNFELSTPRAVRITPEGEVLDPDGILLSDGVPAGARIASNGDGPTLVTLAQPNGSAQFRFLGAGGRLRASQALPEGATAGMDLASNGSDYLAVMTNAHPDFSYDITGRVIRANGTLGAAFPIDPLTNGSGGVVAAVNGYLVASWTNGGTLFSIGAAGRVRSQIALPIATTALTSATDGADTLVSWIPSLGEQASAAVARFFTNGAFHGSTLELAPATSGYPAALAWDGRKYWAVWVVGDSPRPFIRSIGSNGRLGPVSPLFDDECQGPVLASNGRRQLLLSCFAFTNRFRVVSVSTHLIDTSAAAGQ
jgi:hypothetical protein